MARIGAIGEAPNPASSACLGLEYCRQLVPNGEVTLPGSACPTCSNPNLNAIDTWLPLALAERLEGVGGGILARHSQSTSSVFHTARVMKGRGELHLIKGIIVPEGAGTKLAAAGLVGSDFDTIPFLMLNGEYRPLATRQVNYAAVDAMNASPTCKVGPALSLNAEDPIFRGTLQGHTHIQARTDLQEHVDQRGGDMADTSRLVWMPAVALLLLTMNATHAAQGRARDPGVRAGPPAAGGPLPGLTAAELAAFQAGREDFEEV